MKLTDSTKIYVGTSQATKIYIGTTLVWTPAGGGGIPADALLDEAGLSLLDESGNYLLEG